MRRPGPAAAHRAARGPDTGSAAVELVVLAPLLAALLVTVAGLGRVVDARGAVAGAARDAARAASLERSGPAATRAGESAARAAMSGLDARCTDLHVAVDVAGAHPGGAVTATVRCTVDLAGLRLGGLPGHYTADGSATAPVERWRGR